MVNLLFIILLCKQKIVEFLKIIEALQTQKNSKKNTSLWNKNFFLDSKIYLKIRLQSSCYRHAFKTWLENFYKKNMIILWI